jgi:hypothetical protein
MRRTLVVLATALLSVFAQDTRVLIPKSDLEALLAQLQDVQATEAFIPVNPSNGAGAGAEPPMDPMADTDVLNDMMPDSGMEDPGVGNPENVEVDLDELLEPQEKKQLAELLRKLKERLGEDSGSGAVMDEPSEGGSPPSASPQVMQPIIYYIVPPQSPGAKQNEGVGKADAPSEPAAPSVPEHTHPMVQPQPPPPPQEAPPAAPAQSASKWEKLGIVTWNGE